MEGLRLQSAMEYMMTYGWAILIIAVVLGSLIFLGIFNGNSLAPKASPGSCSVTRPNGPLTVSFMSLGGVCNGELPQYVAKLTPLGSGTYTGGISSTVGGLTGTGGGFNTVAFWMLYTGTGTGTAVSLSSNTAIGVTSSCVGLQSGSTTYGVPVSTYDNVWVYVAAVIKNGQASSTGFGTTGDLLYINGVLQSAATGSCTTATASLQSASTVNIGSNGISQTFNGLLANIQVYNTSFSSNDAATLYDEGIGGAPIALQWLVGWWPLNSNANDYSGNGNNANTVNVIYTSNWASKYSAP